MNRSAPIVVAFGGNAMQKSGETGTPEQQIENAYAACGPLADLSRCGARLVLVHGNGPQVGRELERSFVARERVPPLTLDACVAATQGLMGYFLELAMRRALADRMLDAKIAALATVVRVDADDPAFSHPTKPVGTGDRRLVASPLPREILGASAIAALVEAGHVVIAGGGGGIPVVKTRDGRYSGVDAVIDKDHTAALIARQLGARELIDLTNVDFVYRDFGTSRAVPLSRLGVPEAKRMFAEGQFPPGDMGPKITASLSFLEGGGDSVLITSMAGLASALHGVIGTRIRKEGTT